MRRFLLLMLGCAMTLAAQGATITVPDDYPTISAALASARLGDTVLIGAGTYQENLNLTTPKIHLKGSDEGTVRIAGNAARPVLNVKDAHSAVIENLVFETLTPVRAPEWSDRPCVVMVQGTNVTMRNCKFLKGVGYGLRMTVLGKTVIEGCTSQDNFWSGINVFGMNRPGEVVLKGNTCAQNGKHGIEIMREIDALVEDNVLTHNGESGLSTITKVHLTARNNQCRENHQNGMLLRMGTTGDVTHNICEKNGWNGMAVGSFMTDVVCRDNQLNQNGGNGLVFMWGSGGTAQANTCSENGSSGIATSEQYTAPLIENNQCLNNHRHGITMSSASTAKMHDNVCSDNAGYGLYVIDENTAPEMGENNVFEDNALGAEGRDEGRPLNQQYQVVADEIGWLFVNREFARIEALAEVMRQPNSRHPYGGWSLFYLYNGLMTGHDYITPEREALYKAVLAEYIKAFPDSITQKLLVVKLLNKKAWDARGTGWASEVSATGWQDFRKHSRKALEVIETITEPTCPEYYTMRLHLCTNLSCPDEATAWFEEGIEKFPDYWPLYDKRALMLLPRWFGDDGGDVVDLAERGVEKTKDMYGYSFYALVCETVYKYYEINEFHEVHPFDWELVKKGFEDLLEQYPDSSWYLNNFAVQACVFNDRETAAELFAKIGDYPDDNIWHYKNPNYRRWKAWALEDAPYPVKKPVPRSPGSSLIRGVLDLINAF